MPLSVYTTACLLATSATDVPMNGLLALSAPLKVVEGVWSTSCFCVADTMLGYDIYCN